MATGRPVAGIRIAIRYIHRIITPLGALRRFDVREFNNLNVALWRPWMLESLLRQVPWLPADKAPVPAIPAPAHWDVPNHEKQSSRPSSPDQTFPKVPQPAHATH